MKRIKIIIAISVFALMSFSNQRTVDGDCKILHSGTFEYMAGKDKIKVVIEGESHTEYHGKYIIQSKLTWVNDCEYNATLIKATAPDFPFPKGTVMNVKIDRVEGKTIYYTSTIKGQSWAGELKKLK